jgi:YgiT-type zinc finger domain-containing protein
MNRERTTLTYERDGVALQVKYVPAWVCAGCGKRLLTGKVATQVEDMLDRLECGSLSLTDSAKSKVLTQKPIRFLHTE